MGPLPGRTKMVNPLPQRLLAARQRGSLWALGMGDPQRQKLLLAARRKMAGFTFGESTNFADRQPFDSIKLEFKIERNASTAEEFQKTLSQANDFFRVLEYLKDPADKDKWEPVAFVLVANVLGWACREQPS